MVLLLNAPSLLMVFGLPVSLSSLEIVQRGCRTPLVLLGRTCSLAIWRYFLLPPSTLVLTCPAALLLCVALSLPCLARRGSPCPIAVAGHFTQPPVLQLSGVDGGASSRRQPETLLKHADTSAYRIWVQGERRRHSGACTCDQDKPQQAPTKGQVPFPERWLLLGGPPQKPADAC